MSEATPKGAFLSEAGKMSSATPKGAFLSEQSEAGNEAVYSL